MSKVDWSLAPEGATHFLPALSQSHCDVWFKIVDGYAVSAGYERINGWAHSYTKDCQPSTDMTRLISRQEDETKPWSGPEDGLPPVGTVCEWKYADSQTWKATKILYIGSVYVIVPAHDGEQHYYVQHMQFRAVKTPEQQAAQLRETAIRDVMDIAQVDCRVTAARLVDAGFKREVV